MCIKVSFFALQLNKCRHMTTTTCLSMHTISVMNYSAPLCIWTFQPFIIDAEYIGRRGHCFCDVCVFSMCLIIYAFSVKYKANCLIIGHWIIYCFHSNIIVMNQGKCCREHWNHILSACCCFIWYTESKPDVYLI